MTFEDNNKKIDAVSINKPKELNDALYTTPPSAWIILGILLSVIAAILVCIFFVKLPAHISTFATRQGNSLVSYVSPEKAAQISTGMPVFVDSHINGIVNSVSPVCYSREEAKSQIHGDYAKHILELHDWNVLVEINYSGQLDSEIIHEAVITTAMVPLINFFGSGMGS